MTERNTKRISEYKCPMCSQRLCVEKGSTHALALFCGNGPCPSTAANDGEEADTESEAFEKLERSIEEEGLP